MANSLSSSQTSRVRVAVVPVAGLGTRMLPLTRSIAKEMLPLGPKLCIEYVVEELIQAGIEEIIFVVSPGKEIIVDHFQWNEQQDEKLRNAGKAEVADRIKSSFSSGIRFKSVQQSVQKGLGHAVLCAKDTVAQRPFVVALGDSLICGSNAERNLVARLCDIFLNEAVNAAIAFQHVEPGDVSKYGIAMPLDEVSENGSFALKGLIEKPEKSVAPSQWAVCARYVLSAEIFNHLEKTTAGTGGEIQLTDAINAMISTNANACAVCLSDRETRMDIGSIPGYMQAFVQLALGDAEYGPHLRKFIANLLAQS